MATGPFLKSPIEHLVRRIRGEYLEMPGLRLTTPQAQRLFGLDRPTWEAVLASLLEARFLSRARGGGFVMAAA